MYKTFSMELAGRTLSVDVGRVAAQANGAAFMHYGETTVLSTATASEKPREGIDFFPLSVEFEEKLYAVGKIPGVLPAIASCAACRQLALIFPLATTRPTCPLPAGVNCPEA